LGAYAHQDYPFHLMLDKRGLRRDAGHISFGNVLFVLESAPVDGAWPAFASGTPGARLELGALTLESIAVPSRTSAFDLPVPAAADGDGIALAWNYRTDLFATLAVEAMARHFDVLLGRIVADPERRVRHYQLTDGAEARLASALAAPAALASDSTLHGAF